MNHARAHGVKLPDGVVAELDWPAANTRKAGIVKQLHGGLSGLLKRRKVPSTLYFGFGKDEHNKLKGHAWLQCSGIIVTGFCDFSQYQVHSSFS